MKINEIVQENKKIQMESKKLEKIIWPARRSLENPLSLWNEAIRDGIQIQEAYLKLIEKAVTPCTGQHQRLLATIHYDLSVHLNTLCYYCYECHKKSSQTPVCLDQVIHFSQLRLEQITAARNLYMTANDRKPTQACMDEYMTFHQELCAERTLYDVSPAVGSAAVVSRQMSCDTLAACDVLSGLCHSNDNLNNSNSNTDEYTSSQSSSSHTTHPPCAPVVNSNSFYYSSKSLHEELASTSSSCSSSYRSSV